jgi:hypothetical protein
MLTIGEFFYSYCGGFFGRDFYNGRIEAVGFDWAVARDSFGNPALAYFPGGMGKYLKRRRRNKNDKTYYNVKGCG